MSDCERRDEAINIYASAMREVKTRSRALTALLVQVQAAPTAPDVFVPAEGAYLQLRFICELITLAALAAHRDIELGSKLLNEWHAGEAFAALEKINPSCFPTAVQLEDSESDPKHFIPRQATIGRADFPVIYGKCGNALHRGTLKPILAGKQRHYDLDELNHWHQAIMDLLSEHLILIRHPDRCVLVNMRGINDDPEVMYAEAD